MTNRISRLKTALFANTREISLVGRCFIPPAIGKPKANR